MVCVLSSTESLVPSTPLASSHLTQTQTRRLKPNAEALKRIIGGVEGHNKRVLADAVERSQDAKAQDWTVERLGEQREGGREGGEGEREEMEKGTCLVYKFTSLTLCKVTRIEILFC